MRRINSLGSVGAVAVLVLVMSSCGGGSSTADPAPKSTTTTQTQESEPTATQDPGPPEPYFAGKYAVVKTVKRVPKWATDAKAGDTFPRSWVVKPQCAEGSCNGKVISTNPDEKGATRFDYSWSKGKVAFAGTVAKTSCGKGFGTYKRVTTYTMKPSAVKADGSVTTLTGTSTDIITRDSPGSQCYEGVIRFTIAAKAT